MNKKKPSEDKRKGPKRAAAGKPGKPKAVKAKAASQPNGAAHRPVALGVRLHHARMVRGMTLKELADQSQCSESMLSKIENDKAALGRWRKVRPELSGNIKMSVAY